MKRIAASLTLMIYLMGATDANQLLKVPFMIKHFQVHYQQDPKLSIAGFIHMHYINPVIDADHEQDMQLPFKTHSSDGCMISTISMPLQKIEVEVPAIPVDTRNFSGIYISSYSFRPMVNIFQPPRIA
ncbi:MAG: hypothetical protein WAP48_07390 [Sediminibacterium sp.]